MIGGLVLCSPITGEVRAGEQPVAGVRIERALVFGWTGERIHDAAVTDAEGRFAFPAVRRRNLLARWLPHETGIRQTLVLHHAGRAWPVWQHDKTNYRLHGERDGAPLHLACRLEDAPTDD